jgi:hypothetical protein
MAFGLALALVLVVSTVSAGPLIAASRPPVPAVSTTGNPPSCRISDTTTTFNRTADWSRTLVKAIHDSRLTTRVWLWRHGTSPGPTRTPTPAPTDAPNP